MSYVPLPLPEFVTPICVNFEHKKLFPGNIGPSTGEMGTTMDRFGAHPNLLTLALDVTNEGQAVAAAKDALE